MPHRPCSTNVSGSAVFYEVDGEWVQLTRGGEIPPGALVVAVPYADEVELPSVVDAAAGHVPEGTWVFSVDAHGRVAVTTSDDIEATASAYTRVNSRQLADTLVDRTVGGRETRVRDRAEDIAGHAERMFESFAPHPDKPLGVLREDSTTSWQAYDMRRDIEDAISDLFILKHRAERGEGQPVASGHGDYDARIAELIAIQDQLTTVHCAAAFNVPIEVVQRAQQRQFAPVAGLDDITGPDVAVSSSLFHVMTTTLFYNDEYYAVSHRTVDSVWATEHEAQGRAFELRMLSYGKAYEDMRTDVAVGQTDFTAPSTCTNSRAFAVWELVPTRDYYGHGSGGLDERLAGIFPTEAQVTAYAEEQKFTHYFSEEEQQERVVFSAAFGEDPQEVVVDVQSELDLAQGVRLDNSAREALDGGLPERDFVGHRSACTGAVRVNTAPELYELGQQLVSQRAYDQQQEHSW